MTARIFVLGLFTLILTSAGCGGGSDEAGAMDGEPAAIVNGYVITVEDFNTFLAQKSQTQPNTPLNPSIVLNEMINMELLKQQAVQDGFEKRQEIHRELERVRTNLLVNTLINEKLADMTFTDEQMKAEYEEQIARLDDMEYKGRHILTETEDQAQDIIKQLQKDKDFAELSKAHSIAPSAQQGGDLGWFNPGNMLPPFAEAVKSLKKGTYTNKPVLTRHGWHVILVEDQRKFDRPKFEDVQDRLQSILANKALQTYIQKLRDNAEITINTSS